MSFGFSVGDFVAVAQLCWGLYRKCKDSTGNYQQLSYEVGALHNAIKETEELLTQQDLTAKEKGKLQESRVGCEAVLRDLDKLLAKYKSLGTQSQRTRDRMGLGSQEINSIRIRLISNVTLLDTFNNASSHARLESKLDQFILEVRSGKREGSIISISTIDSVARDDQQTWEALRRELEDVGITSAIIIEKRQFIVRWFEDAVAAGKLEEDAPGNGNDSDTALSDQTESSADSLSIDTCHEYIDSDSAPPLTAVGQSTGCLITDPQQSPQHSRLSSQLSRPTAKKLSSRVSYLLSKLQSSGSAILKAVDSGDAAEVRSLLEKGAPIKAKSSSGWTLLHSAASMPHFEITQLLLENNANIEVRDSDKNTPLILASFSGNAAVVQLLLAHGADIDARDSEGSSPLHAACRKGQNDVVQLLLESNAFIDAKDSDSKTPVHAASLGGHAEIVQLLLSRNANTDARDSHGRSPLYIASLGGHAEIVQLLLTRNANTDARDSEGRSALYVACTYGQTYVVQILLAKNANVDAKKADGATPVHVACRFGYHEILQLLLKNLAKVDVEGPRGWSPLHYACGEGQVDCAWMLLEAQAYVVDAEDEDGSTPLHMACGRHEGNDDCVSLLLKMGANVNSMMRTQRLTPLHLAALRGRVGAARLLLEKGAYINATNWRGRTPLGECKDSATADLLRDYGGVE